MGNPGPPTTAVQPDDGNAGERADVMLFGARPNSIGSPTQRRWFAPMWRPRFVPVESRLRHSAAIPMKTADDLDPELT
jgi:hypothetical protein